MTPSPLNVWHARLQMRRSLNSRIVRGQLDDCKKCKLMLTVVVSALRFPRYCLTSDQLVHRRATQTTETSIENHVKHNMVKNPKWREANQLAAVFTSAAGLRIWKIGTAWSYKIRFVACPAYPSKFISYVSSIELWVRVLLFTYSFVFLMVQKLMSNTKF